MKILFLYEHAVVSVSMSLSLRIPGRVTAPSISSFSSFRSASANNLGRCLTISRNSLNTIPLLQVEESQPISIPVIPTTHEEDGEEDNDEEEGDRISGIEVPRQKHIPVSKSDLIDAIVSNMFDGDSQQVIDQFLHLSACLDSILHAEHKDILEDIRAYFDSTQPPASKGINGEKSSTQERKPVANGTEHDAIMGKSINGSAKIFSDEQIDFERWMPFDFNLDPRSLSSSQKKGTGIPRKESRYDKYFQQSDFSDEDLHDHMTRDDPESRGDMPIWYAAERAVNRYEGILSSAGPRGRLFRKFLAWIGLSPSTPKQTLELNSNTINSELYLRPIFLPRIALSDLWTPASRKYCGNDLWKMLKTAAGILFSKSVLQEPAFQELILLYTKEVDDNNTKQEATDPPLQLKIYEKIPIPDLPVVFPHKKLSFRILDTVRLDTASILGLLAYILNYKFVDISSSPSAVVLDVIGISALVIYVSRVVLGYKQTWDRYQLLVNRTLYEKTVASGFGSVHFLIDASEQQQFKEAILAYVVLLKEKNGQMSSLETVGEKCEKFIYTAFKEKVKMPMEKAKNTLLRLGIVSEKVVDGKVLLQAIPCRRASEILEERWASLLG